MTDKEKKAISVLNFVAQFDGCFHNEKEIKYLLRQGIIKYVSPKRRHLVKITKTAYPPKIYINYD